MNATSDSSRRPLRFRWHRWRRLLGALSAATAAAGALLVLRPPPPPAAEVLVAARDLSGLAPLTGADTVVREVPEALLPEGALPAGHRVEGVSLRSPVRAGEILTEVRLADPPAAGYGADLVAAPVRLADADAVALLRPGSRIDVLAAVGDPLAAGFAGDGAVAARTIVADRPVVAVPSADPAAGEAGALVVLAVTEEEARSLAGHAGAGRLSIAIRG
ncbi:Flp pilus assembly protein CpaB [Thermobifida halotolerans]|uniref:Flp pilus assembly protein CpaB n=1 Tax=Thermobifida halotolerans TaxID=483545 RepID=A0AA97LX42_9ACTN|nr:RcpC/CpaB family pilus assembly protein [Thermobifida halotolerans]UOE19461.1 Flp pilus assembly protein CpaB [Thermobifida halotolerans]